MSLKEQLFADLKESMKTKDTVRKNSVQSVRAAILQKEKDERITLNEEQIILIVASEVKKRKSALPEFVKSGRQDLIDELELEIKIISGYLPEQMTEEEVRKVVQETIEQVEATSMKDMGKVMGAIVPKVQGKADNSLVSQIVKSILS